MDPLTAVSVVEIVPSSLTVYVSASATGSLLGIIVMVNVSVSVVVPSDTV